MISKGNHVKFARSVLLPVSEKAKTMTSTFFRSMYNKTIIRFVFCDIQNNLGPGKLRLITLTPPGLFWISQKPHPIVVYKLNRNLLKSHNVSMSFLGKQPNIMQSSLLQSSQVQRVCQYRLQFVWSCFGSVLMSYRVSHAVEVNNCYVV